MPLATVSAQQPSHNPDDSLKRHNGARGGDGESQSLLGEQRQETSNSTGGQSHQQCEGGYLIDKSRERLPGRGAFCGSGRGNPLVIVWAEHHRCQATGAETPDANSDEARLPIAPEGWHAQTSEEDGELDAGLLEPDHQPTFRGVQSNCDEFVGGGVAPPLRNAANERCDDEHQKRVGYTSEGQPDPAAEEYHHRASLGSEEIGEPAKPRGQNRPNPSIGSAEPSDITTREVELFNDVSGQYRDREQLKRGHHHRHDHHHGQGNRGAFH